MRTSSPTNRGLPSLVASTRPAIAAGSSSAPMTFAASRVAAAASRPPSVTTSATRPPRRRQRGAQLAQLGARRREDEQRHARAPLHQMLGQVEQQRLRPLQVVDDEHHRLRRRERGELAADDEERFFRRRRRAGEQRGDTGSDASRSESSPGTTASIAARSGVAAGAVVDAQAARARPRRCGANVAPPAASHCAPSAPARRGLAEPAGDLVDQARLAEARRSEDHGQARAPRCDGRVVDRREARRSSSSRPTNGVADAPAGRSSDTTRYAATVSARPFSERTPNGLERHQLAHQALRRLADQHVAVAAPPAAAAPRRSADRRCRRRSRR